MDTGRQAGTMAGAAGAWSMTRGRPHAFLSRPFEAPLGPRLRSALAVEHARRPFAPRDVRDAARRCVSVARGLDLAARVVRGGLDVGGAELDHVWADVDGHVVDVALPVNATSFVTVLRAFVAGDLHEDELDRAAHGYPLESRVIGVFPRTCRYLGLPVFGQRGDGDDSDLETVA